jgi:PleD family two-component response regulator
MHLQAEGALHQVHGGLQDLAALRRDELRQRLCVEARVREAQASVHAVCRQLQRLLPDVVLLQLDLQSAPGFSLRLMDAQDSHVV